MKFVKAMLAVGLSAAIAASAMTAVQAKQLTIGFSQIGAESEWRTANTNEIALQLAASELSDAADKAKTNEQVWNLMNAFFEEVQQYGVHYYAGKD